MLEIIAHRSVTNLFTGAHTVIEVFHLTHTSAAVANKMVELLKHRQILTGEDSVVYKRDGEIVRQTLPTPRIAPLMEKERLCAIPQTRCTSPATFFFQDPADERYNFDLCPKHAMVYRRRYPTRVRAYAKAPPEGELFPNCRLNLVPGPPARTRNTPYAVPMSAYVADLRQGIRVLGVGQTTCRLSPSSKETQKRRAQRSK